MSLPNCPKCNSEYVYEDGILLVCPECAYEWDPNEVAEEEGLVVLDSNGTRLADGDTVTVIKDLKVKGAPKDIKQGTRVKNIRYSAAGTFPNTNEVKHLHKRFISWIPELDCIRSVQRIAGSSISR